MFLRSTKRQKDDEDYYYWALVESRRCEGEGVVAAHMLTFRRKNWRSTSAAGVADR